MEVDEEYGAGEKMEVDQQDEDIYSMIKSCKFNMKMKMIESARKQVTILSESFQFWKKMYINYRWKSLIGDLRHLFARADLVCLGPCCPGHFESSEKENNWINVNEKFDDNLLLLETCLKAPLITDGF